MPEKKDAEREALCALWLSNIKNLNALQKKVLLEELGGACAVRAADASRLRSLFESRPEFKRAPAAALDALAGGDLATAEKMMKECRRRGISIVAWGTEEYPKRLAEISDPPAALYAIGDVSLLNTPSVAVVGTRRSSPYGRWAAREIGRRIGGAGVTVVSGMAEGIDSMGHRGCLDKKGSTIAVLGTGVDVCFPRSNRELYGQIAREGLLISEFIPGEQAWAWNFPQRNRLISGLSSAVIVVEGALKSGSMITANLAAEQGRDVYAVPGNINQPNSVGVNRLIADGACPVYSLESLEESLGLVRPGEGRSVPSLSPQEKRVFALVKQEPGAGCELLAVKLDESPLDLRTLLMAMELKGLVRCEDGRYYVC